MVALKVQYQRSFLMAVSVVVLLGSEALSADSDPDGFRGIAWGSPIAKYANVLQKSGQLNETHIWYKRVDDKMAVGDAKLYNIAYLFRNGVFSYAVMDAIHENEQPLSDVVVRLFGNGERVTDPTKIAWWPRNRFGKIIRGREHFVVAAERTTILRIVGRINDFGTSMTTVYVMSTADLQAKQREQGSALEESAKRARNDF